MCFNSYFIGGMYFRLMQTRFYSRLTINFFYLVCIFIFKNITLDQDNSIGSLCKTLGSVQCKARMLHYWLSLRKFSHILFSLHPPKGYRESDKTFNQPNSCGIILVLHDDLGFIRYYLLFGKRVF